MPEEEDIFSAAAALPVEEREMYLDAACAGDPGVRARVDGLLRSHEATGFTGDRTAVPLAPGPASTESPSSIIGRYKLLQQIGEGGFGVVWMAEQEEPIRRRVALKILKAGMDTREVIARFGAERQALAMMDHPSIARIFDAGETASGRPYFVMELVRGFPITRFCDERALTTRQRLELFEEVCEAVAHAHQKGIIHRDLKPSNIMVTLHGEKPVPKLIDFGIAKATPGRLTDRTLFTRFEQFVGTPAYMSPEQVGLSGLDVDTRSDIYALGVLLYELLTGKPPFDTKSLISAGYEEMCRIIREVDPPRPSARISTAAGEERTALARARQIEPEKLNKLVKSDLDWIVMKAIEKNRARRYETANGLARDIRRFLAGEAVSASSPGAAYRFRKFALRHKLSLSAGAAVLSALVIALIVALWQVDENRWLRELAEARRAEAELEAKRAVRSESIAKRNLYAAHMNEVREALPQNDIGLARELLDMYRPKGDEPDLRGWEWRYYYQQCLSEAQARLPNGDERPPVFSASISSDGSRLLLGYGGGQLELWDVAARELVRVVQEPFGHPARSVFSPKGDAFAATTGPGLVKIAHAGTGAEVFSSTIDGVVRDISWSRDGEWLAVLSRDPERLMVLRAADGSTVMNYDTLSEGGGDFFGNVRISGDKQRVYISSGAFGSPTLRCVSVPDGDTVWKIPIGSIDEIEPGRVRDIGFSAMALSPDGETLVVATGYRDPKIRVIEAARGRHLAKLEGHTKYVLQLAFSDDGQALVSASEDQTIRLWNTSTWAESRPPLRGHAHEVSAVALSSQGDLLASGGKDGEVLLWDPRSPPPAKGMGKLPGGIVELRFVPESRLVAARTVDFQWLLIDPATLDAEPVLQSVTPPGETGYAPLVARKDRRRPPPSGVDEPRLGLRGKVTAHATSPDGNLFVAVSDGGEIGFYDAKTYIRLGIRRSHLSSVFGITFSPEGNFLALSSGGDNGIVVWDAVTRLKLATLSSPGSLLGNIRFTADGSTLLAAPEFEGSGESGAFQVWHVPSLEEIDEAEKSAGKWPMAGAIRPFGLARLKHLLEQEWRREIDAAAGSRQEVARLNDTLEHLADLLFHERREAEARPFLADLLDRLKRQPSPDTRTIFETTRKLLTATLAQLRATGGSAGSGEDGEDGAQLSAQADQLVSDMVATYTRLSAERPEDSLVAMKRDMMEMWFVGNSDKVHLENVRGLLALAEGRPNDAESMRHAVTACCATPSGNRELDERALALAKRGVELTADSWAVALHHHTMGLASFRCGNFAEADTALLRAFETAGLLTGWMAEEYRPSIQHSALFVRSMILHHEGKQEEAERLFHKAGEHMQRPPDDPRTALDGSLFGADFVVWMLWKEAKALFPKRDPEQSSR